MGLNLILCQVARTEWEKPGIDCFISNFVLRSRIELNRVQKLDQFIDNSRVGKRQASDTVHSPEENVGGKTH